MKLPRRKNRNHLSLYRRHAGSCTATNDISCGCPIWVQGRVQGVYIREALGTRSLGAAEEKMRAMLDPDRPDGPGSPQKLPAAGSMSLDAAKTAFLGAKKDLSTNSVKIYTTVCRHFTRFAEVQGITELRQVTPDLLDTYFDEYGSTWKSPRTRNGRLIHLRVFFNHCIKKKWLHDSPASGLAPFRSPGHARAPFSDQEIDRILAAAEQMPPADRDTARALVLLLLYSGMRISDATFLQRRAIGVGNVLDYVAIKVRKRIDLPMELHQSAVDALAKVPGGGQDFVFLPDGDYREAITALDSGGYFEKHLPAGIYQRAIDRHERLLRRLMAIANVHGLAHRYRDTFAVSMLVKGVSMDTVSMALGHSNVSITRKHYLNLVPGYRERMSGATRVLDYSRPQLLSSAS